MSQEIGRGWHGVSGDDLLISEIQCVPGTVPYAAEVPPVAETRGTPRNYADVHLSRVFAMSDVVVPVADKMVSAGEAVQALIPSGPDPRITREDALNVTDALDYLRGIAHDPEKTPQLTGIFLNIGHTALLKGRYGWSEAILDETVRLAKTYRGANPRDRRMTMSLKRYAHAMRSYVRHLNGDTAGSWQDLSSSILIEPQVGTITLDAETKSNSLKPKLRQTETAKEAAFNRQLAVNDVGVKYYSAASLYLKGMAGDAGAITESAIKFVSANDILASRVPRTIQLGNLLLARQVEAALDGDNLQVPGTKLRSSAAAIVKMATILPDSFLATLDERGLERAHAAQVTGSVLLGTYGRKNRLDMGWQKVAAEKEEPAPPLPPPEISDKPARVRAFATPRSELRRLYAGSRAGMAPPGHTPRYNHQRQA